MRGTKSWRGLLRQRNGIVSLLDYENFCLLSIAAKLSKENSISAAVRKVSSTPLYPKHYNAIPISGPKGILEGLALTYGPKYLHERSVRSLWSCQILIKSGAGSFNRCVARTFASKASNQQKKSESETQDKKEISTVEDPFDAPTSNIPEKPVTFAEGASYSVVILAGLGVAAAAGYAVFKELIFEPKEYKVFNKALKRIQEDSQVSIRIGSPITGYGQESRNRAARQRIANKIFTDEDGVEHVQIGFYIRGPHGAGKVAAEMFKDKVDKQWKYTYLIVQITQPSQAQIILESYIPEAFPVTA